MNENVKKALFVLLYDQFDSPCIKLRDSDETYINYIISVLIEKNKNRCPFKCYDCIGECNRNQLDCVEGIELCCDREIEEVWRDFIDI